MNISCDSLNTVFHEQHPYLPANNINTYVTELAACHFPAEFKNKERADLVHAIQETRGVKARTPLCEHISEIIRSLYTLRFNTFDIINTGTSEVAGRLKTGCSEIQRDDYIRELINYHYLRCEVKDMMEKNELRLDDIERVLRHHHSTALYGDLQALAAVMRGEAQQIPALTYNQGAEQFG
ncbi:NleF caspase inhibitor [Martelella alba]|uniref:Uncharacterized protein n=1 Tax=Martelella alba TaxID=2590451 RepID=A0ABY2SNG5_9HYPH|nr:NleF caspase inhibitor [Martelella alba]TKI06972.1 hypothetical protein FCN80_08480 [Martelella alba]